MRDGVKVSKRETIRNREREIVREKLEQRKKESVLKRRYTKCASERLRIKKEQLSKKREMLYIC